MVTLVSCIIFFFNDTATTEIYTLSLHDALPIFYDISDPEAPVRMSTTPFGFKFENEDVATNGEIMIFSDRKSTRLNSSHANISYAVFCLKKKKERRVRRHLHPMN